MTTALDDPQAALERENAELRQQLDERTAELREALERQTAIAEVLGVINASPGNLAPVFDAMLEKAMRLCGGSFGSFARFDGEFFHAVAHRNVPSELVEALREPIPPTPGGHLIQIAGGAPIVHIADFADTEAYRSGKRWAVALVDKGGSRTAVWVALRRDQELLGVLVIYRLEVRPFTDKQIALLQNFAAQAVIAMENARLITETREALEQQTATAEVLQVINSSPGDLAPVFDAILEKAHGLCGAAQGALVTYDGERFRAVATRGLSEAYATLLREPQDNPPGSPPLQLLSGERLVHIPDFRTIALPIPRAAAEVEGARTVLFVPLRKDSALLGYITAYRQEVRPFSEKEIALLENFAAQAVIAMENARLITETREALEQQTATAEVLQVINSSPGDLAPVFEAMLEKAIRLCEGVQGTLWTFSGERMHLIASQGLPTAFVEILRDRRERADPGESDPVRRVMRGECLIQLLDVTVDRSHGPVIEAAAEYGGVGSIIFVGLAKDSGRLGCFTISRREVRPFSDKQIALLQNFAAQAVIAMDNARLMEEIRAARDAAEKSLAELRTAQASLIHAEKMASLGQLTAGVAHEIKNPLNFVNNFAGLSVELLDELKEMAAPALAALSDEMRAEAEEIVATLTGNLEKIAEHGRRADGIVKSMLDHSRGGSSEQRSVDINALVEEALSLAYHSARAQDQDFNVALERDLEPDIAPIVLMPQDLTRVFLNLFGNGFYAVDKRRREAADAAFRPMLRVATRDLGGEVEIRVRDNGAGIAPELRDKLFQPFFTTKPTGEGTGLGLSISWDIVTQQHGGTIEVDSVMGEYAEFTIRLPRRAAAGARLPTGAVVAYGG